MIKCSLSFVFLNICRNLLNFLLFHSLEHVLDWQPMCCCFPWILSRLACRAAEASWQPVDLGASMQDLDRLPWLLLQEVAIVAVELYLLKRYYLALNIGIAHDLVNHSG